VHVGRVLFFAQDRELVKKCEKKPEKARYHVDKRDLKEYNNKSGLFRQISQKFELIREETSWTVEVPTAHQRAEVCGYHTVDRVIVSA